MPQLSLLFFFFLTFISSANVDPEPEDRSPMTAIPGRFGILLGGSESEGNGSTFTWQQLRLDGGFALNRDLSEDLKLFYGVTYRFTNIDQGRKPVGQKLGDLHDIILPLSLSYRPEGSPWSFFGQVSAQLATDFSSVTSDDLDYTWRLGGQYKFSDTFSINFGVARVRNFARTFIFPSAGFVWAPTDDWSLTLTGPRFTLSHRVNDCFILRAGGFPTGGLWNVDDDNGNSVDYGFASYNVGCGVDYKWRRGIWLSLWSGANFANDFRAEQGGDRLFKEKLETGWFTYLGVNLYEW